MSCCSSPIPASRNARGDPGRLDVGVRAHDGVGVGHRHALRAAQRHEQLERHADALADLARRVARLAAHRALGADEQQAPVAAAACSSASSTPSAASRSSSSSRASRALPSRPSSRPSAAKSTPIPGSLGPAPAATDRRPAMAPTRRRRMPAAQRREVILVAAEETFARSGYHGASLDDIAHAAGVSKALIYEHFESKRETARLAPGRAGGRDLPPPRGRRRARRDREGAPAQRHRRVPALPSRSAARRGGRSVPRRRRTPRSRR